MNFLQALVCIVLIAAIECLTYYFYSFVNKEKHNKKEPDTKSNPSTEPVLTTEGLRMTNTGRKPNHSNAGKGAKASQGDNSIANQIPGVNHGNVNVFNINNYTQGIGRDDIYSKDVISKAGETEEETSGDKKKKPGAKVYFLRRENEESKKISSTPKAARKR